MITNKTLAGLGLLVLLSAQSAPLFAQSSKQFELNPDEDSTEEADDSAQAPADAAQDEPAEAQPTTTAAPATAPAAPVAASEPTKDKEEQVEEKAPTPKKRTLPDLNVGGDGGGLTLPAGDQSLDGLGTFVFDSDARDPNKPKDKRWRLLFGGYVRMMYKSIANDENQPLIGANDGFLLANARPTFTGVLKNGLGFRLQMELAANLDNPDTTTPAREMLVRPRDTYIFYHTSSYLELQLGQFKPPHDLEGLMSTGAVVFAERSIGSRGVAPFEAQNPISGLSIDRQIGVQALGQYFPTSADNSAKGFGLRYAVAVTNGTSSNQTVNDNDALAYYGRLSLHWGDYVSLGGGYMRNSLLIGTAPDQVGVTRTGLTGDLYVHAYGAHVFASYQQQSDSTDLFTNRNPDGEDATLVTASTYQVQLGYHIPVVHLMPTVRYAFFDPTSSFNDTAVNEPGQDIRQVDALTYITLGLNYVAPTYPVQVMLNYTLAQEQEARAINNDQLDLLVQMTW